MLEGWVENCPGKGENIGLMECRKCEYFTKLDCIFIICGYRGRYSKRRIAYRENRLEKRLFSEIDEE
ncbi:hypothetical protein RSJ42_04380 [Methanosarcina hadiensis]|uniref:hypothetical protein n=1 Tax=Methanosarcina hadiensis TaxID=3078083 RepID=UPI003977B94B